jgi:hypothetical protein
MPVIDAPIFHDGQWSLCDVAAVDDSSANLAAWRWTSLPDLRVVVVNLGDGVAQGRVHVGDALPDAASLAFEDLLDGKTYQWERRDLIESGLYVRLASGQAHIFAVRPPPNTTPTKPPKKQ